MLEPKCKEHMQIESKLADSSPQTHWRHSTVKYSKPSRTQTLMYASNRSYAHLRSDRKRWWEANLWGDTSSRISPCLHFRVQPEQRLAQSDRWSSISALLLSTSCYKLQKMRGFWHRAFASTAITHKLGDKPLQSTMDLILLTPRQFWWKLHSALPSLLVMLQLALCHSSKETVAKLWKDFF